jgi:hypothetical protein
MQRQIKEFAAAIAILSSGFAFADDAPEMQVAKPGTPEAKRLASLRAKAQAGLVPVHQMGGFPGPKTVPNAIPLSVGTRIVPHPDAKGAMLKFQQAFVSAFSKQDPEPANRIAHFSWLPKLDHVRHLGWWGSVTGAQPQPDGSMLVTIRISPHLASPQMKTLVLDHVTEMYHVADGKFHLVDSDAAIPKLHLQTFPVH